MQIIKIKGRKKRYRDIIRTVICQSKVFEQKVVGVIADLVHISKNNSHKRKVLSKDKCFNYHKIGHYGRDYKYPDYKLLKKKSNSNTK